MRQFQICPSRKFCLQNQPTRSRFFSERSYWLSPKLTEFEYKYPALNHNLHSLATTNYPTSPRRNSPNHSSHLNIQKISSIPFHHQARKSSAHETIQRLFRLQNCLSANHQQPKIFKNFFPCRLVLAANHQYPGNIQRFSQQQQPAAATSNSNQQQQPAAAISSSDQQQRPKAATSSSDQQQQSTAATGISNQHSSYQQHLHNQRRTPLGITTVPSRTYPASS